MIWTGRLLGLLAIVGALVLARADVVLGWNSSVVVTALLLGVAATALNLMFGYAGMLSMGNAVFLGVAAFGMGIGVIRLELPLLPSLVLAIVISTAVAFLAGALLVRIPGIYFSVVMLGLVVAFEGLIRAFPSVTGGASGLVLPAVLNLGFTEIVDVDDWFWFSLCISAVVLGAVYLFTWGSTGRLLRLIRRDELAASVLGVNVYRAKLVVFVVAGMLTGMAGTLMFLWQRVQVPESAGLLRSVELVSLVVVGGLGTRLGGFVGAAVLMWIQELALTQGNWTELIYGATFLLVILYAPRGVVGILSDGWRRVTSRYAIPPPLVDKTSTSDVAAATGQGALRAEVAAHPAAVVPARSEARTGLVVDAVSRSFGGVAAVQNVSIAVPPGSLIGLVGANGAGKSTLMNLVSGVETVDAGTITLNGHELHDHMPHQVAARGVARTFQVPRLVDEMTVLENVTIGGDALSGRVFRKLASTEKKRTEQSMEALRRADLAHLAHRTVGTLGTGERKYVELVRALAWDPSVLMMDEPAVGLSDHEIDRLERWLKDLRAQGAAVLLIDHNLDFVDRLVDYVYIMKEGHVTEEGPPADLLKRAARRAAKEVVS